MLGSPGARRQQLTPEEPDVAESRGLCGKKCTWLSASHAVSFVQLGRCAAGLMLLYPCKACMCSHQSTVEEDLALYTVKEKCHRSCFSVIQHTLCGNGACRRDEPRGREMGQHKDIAPLQFWMFPLARRDLIIKHSHGGRAEPLPYHQNDVAGHAKMARTDH